MPRRGDVPELSLNVLFVPHFGQLTREICPRLVTAVTMCPRSSSHFAHNLPDNLAFASFAIRGPV